MQLIGRYYHALEQKGRLSIPAGFRKFLGKQAIITAGLEGCLFMFTADNWQVVVDQAANLPFTLKRSRDWVRYLANNASEVTFDKLGRILIPEHLRSYAKLHKQACVVGSMNRVEIWDQDTYHQYLDNLMKQAEVIAESISQSS